MQKGETVIPSRAMSRLDRYYGWVMNVFLCVTVVLPSGSIYGFKFKYPIYACLLPLAFYKFFRRGLASPSLIALMLGVPGVFAFWVILGVVHGFPLAGCLRQYSDGLLMTWLMCWLAFVYAADEDAGRLRFLRLVLNASIATALFKIGLIVYAVARGIPTVQVVAGMDDIFGVNLMTMDLGALFGRVQFVSDALIPVSIFILLRYRDRLQIGSLRAALSILLLIASVGFSFSRYFWGFTAVAFPLGLALGRKDRFRWILAGLLAFSVLLSLPALTTLFELRFSNGVAGPSDQLRREQFVALREFYSQAPILGHGLGSYPSRVLREQDDATLNFSYEEQLLALCGQIGFIGVSLLALITLFYYSDLWWKSRLRMADRFGIATLVLCWLAAGLYNPLLFHPIAGVNYAAFAMLAGMGEETEKLREASRGSIPRSLNAETVPI